MIKYDSYQPYTVTAVATKMKYWADVCWKLQTASFVLIQSSRISQLSIQCSLDIVPSLINAKQMFCNGNDVTPSVDWAMQSMWSDKDERNVGRNGSWRWAIGQNDCTLLYRQVLSYIWVLGPQTSVNVYLECLSLVLWHRYLIARLWHVLVDWPVCRLPMLHRHASPIPVLISGIKHMHHLVAWLWYVFMASM